MFRLILVDLTESVWQLLNNYDMCTDCCCIHHNRSCLVLMGNKYLLVFYNGPKNTRKQVVKIVGV